MRLFKRDTPDSVIRLVVECGASREVAVEIVEALLGCGLSPAEAREWLGHENRAYPIKTPWQLDAASPVVMLSNSPVAMIERGETERVLAEALEFAEASAEERTIARLLWGDIDAVRRLTALDRRRTMVIAGIATTLLARLKSPERVCYCAQTVLPGHGDLRMVDRLLKGQEDAVAAELADGRIDARELERTGELVFIGW